MELVNYLESNFRTRGRLLELSGIVDAVLQAWIDAGVMPRASYRLDVSLVCDSFLGPHREDLSVEYFARGYVAWLETLQGLENPAEAKAVFRRRYLARLDLLASRGFESGFPKFREELDAHLDREWGHFLDGVYGLCTRSGLPEDIAAKELATAIIESLIDRENLGSREMSSLEAAVDLLDESASHFAPHERRASSRYRLVDEVRRSFGLTATPDPRGPEKVPRGASDLESVYRAPRGQ